MEISKIYIASDHAGFEAKEFSKECLLKLGFTFIDLGTNSSDVSVDYPDYADSLAKSLNKKNEFGILICGTGLGICMVANRYSHIRCALCHDATTAKLAREHNDANVLCFGSRIISNSVIEDMIKVFFTTEFANGRHEKRVSKMGTFRC